MFERLVAAGELDEALALWRGPALAGLAGEYRFATAAAARLEDLGFARRRTASAPSWRSARGAALLGELEALLAEHPLDERLPRC